MILVGIYVENPFLIMIVGFLVYQNFIQLSKVASVGVLRSANRHSKDLLQEAQEAIESGDPERASRLCQQMRSNGFVAESLQHKMWAILAVSSYAMGDAEDADDYAKHAPDKVVLAMFDRLPKESSE